MNQQGYLKLLYKNVSIYLSNNVIYLSNKSKNTVFRCGMNSSNDTSHPRALGRRPCAQRSHTDRQTHVLVYVCVEY